MPPQEQNACPVTGSGEGMGRGSLLWQIGNEILPQRASETGPNAAPEMGGGRSGASQRNL